LFLKSTILTLVIAAAIGATVQSMRSEYRGSRVGHVDADYIDSKKCVVCHAGHYQSWSRTYHSRMTQDARPETVQGDFDNKIFEYQGISARMERHDRAFQMIFTFPDGRVETDRIVRTVGSRRIEQYVTEQNGQYSRLPVAYDLVNRRWMNLNGSFFHADGKDYFGLRTPWDPNCVFCHNVKAQPNYDFDTKKFQTDVAELGVACGACHGPAATHADRAASPFTRALWRLSDQSARNIVNPTKLSPERSLMVCGHCHGQRVPQPIDRIREILGRGDPYNAGDDLAANFKPVSRETKVGDYSFANRFWSNGSPRLTAYEYQGVLRSACFVRGEGRNKITCLSCHSMHDGDPKGQITAENRTNKACLSCHNQYEAEASLIKHTGHSAASDGSLCYNCHMPRVVYGVMSIHPTHEITIPDPAVTISGLVPNACNQCHLDRSVNWAVDQSKRLWPARFAQASPSQDPQFNVAEGPRSLLAGDALTRALAAEALAGGGPGRPDPRWASAWLVEALRDDYPIVRFFAANGLAPMWTTMSKPDYLKPADCLSASDRCRLKLDPLLTQTIANDAPILRAKRPNVDIEVGE
jgi:predicted CXXCH cytochrome family protein